MRKEQPRTYTKQHKTNLVERCDRRKSIAAPRLRIFLSPEPESRRLTLGLDLSTASRLVESCALLRLNLLFLPVFVQCHVNHFSLRHSRATSRAISLSFDHHACSN